MTRYGSSMTFSLFIVGFISIFSQVAILRELNVAYYGVELIYVIAIGLWMLWSALGAAVGRRAGVPSPGRLSWLFIGFGLLLFADMAFIRGMRVLFVGIPGTYLSFNRQMFGMAMALLPIGVALGLAFQWAAKIYVSRGSRSLAMAYGIESMGAILGGICATVLMALGISNLSTLILCAVVSAGAAILPIDGIKSRWMSMAAGAVLVVFLAGLVMVNRLDRYMTSWNHPDIIESRDSPYSRVSLAGREGQLVVYENDVLSFETEGTTAEEFVHLSALNHPAPIRVLVSGGGVEGLIHEVRKHGAVSIDYVEINRDLLEIVRRHLPEAFRAENARIVEADPRSFLKTAEPYDLILNGMPEPVSGSTNRFYTREYFRLCSEKLAPNGVFAFRLPSLENLWTKFLTYRNTSIYNALTAEFKDVVVLPGVTNTFIAAHRPLTRDPTPLVKRFRRKLIRSRLISDDYVRYVYTNDRFSEIVSLLTSTDAPANTDRRPICYQYSTLLWLSKLLPDIINQHPAQLQTSALWTAAAAVLLAVPLILFLSYRSRIGPGRVTAVFCAGLLGMIAETLLILHYQVKSGVLFQNIGILLTAFMAGLTTGAIGMAGFFPSPSRRTGKSIAAGFGVFSLLLAWILHGGHAGSLGAVSALLFVSGGLVAALFAQVSLAVGNDQKAVVSPLYAADLLGGCIGAIIAGLILIPFFGMDQTAMIMILVSAIVFFLI